MKFAKSVALLITVIGSSLLACLSVQAKVSIYNEITWVELIPANELEILMNPPEQLMMMPDSAFADDLFQALDSEPDPAADAYFAALSSSNIVPDHLKKNIRLPGFVVPLEFNEQQLVTEFFLVPYFGACIHNPPPPPNQTLYVASLDGIEIEDIAMPIWVHGQLQDKVIENDTAKSVYFMQLEEFEMY